MGQVIVVEGADQLAGALRRAQRLLADTTTADRDAAESVRRSARPPVQTGHLARSVVVRSTTDGAQVGWTARYAAAVNNGTRYMPGRHFAQAAAAAADWTDHYRDHVQDVLDTITT